MAFQVSPGVQVKEIDATSVIPAVSTSIGGYAGAFDWGPVEEITLVSSEDNMASIFSTPTNRTAESFLTAASFLKYGNALKVIRVVDATAKNASATGTQTILVKNETVLENTTFQAGSVGWAIAKYPGALGNSIKVEVSVAGASSSFSSWTARDQFDDAPGTSDFAKGLGFTVASDEVHVAVIDNDGKISGTPGTILETFAFMSQALDAKDSSGSSIYYKNVINNQSQYIAVGEGLSTLSALDGQGANGAADLPIAEALSDATQSFGSLFNSTAFAGGLDGAQVDQGEIVNGLDLFADAETVDVNLLFSTPDQGATDKTIAEKLIAVAAARKDCMAFVSPSIVNSRSASAASTIAEWASGTNGLTSTSYASCDSGAVYVYNKYADEYLYIGASGLCAGLCANTDSVADAWFSPAGVNRGQLLGVTKLAYNPTKAQRDELYKARVNPLVSFPGQGTMLFGDKTLLSRPSAFDRINVRRLFNTLEKAIATAAKAQLFELNDEFTRAQFRNMIEPFLRDVKGRRGLTDFLVVCDDSNNTGQVIDTNRFVADIYIKPARSINFITLNFIATRTGVDFSEVAGG